MWKCCRNILQCFAETLIDLCWVGSYFLHFSFCVIALIIILSLPVVWIIWYKKNNFITSSKNLIRFKLINTHIDENRSISSISTKKISASLALCNSQFRARNLPWKSKVIARSGNSQTAQAICRLWEPPFLEINLIKKFVPQNHIRTRVCMLKKLKHIRK